MTPILYVAAWFILTAAVFVSVFAGTLTREGLFIYALLGLGLVFARRLWSLIADGRQTKTR